MRTLTNQEKLQAKHLAMCRLKEAGHITQRLIIETPLELQEIAKCFEGNQAIFAEFIDSRTVVNALQKKITELETYIAVLKTAPKPEPKSEPKQVDSITPEEVISGLAKTDKPRFEKAVKAARASAAKTTETPAETEE